MAEDDGDKDHNPGRQRWLVVLGALALRFRGQLSVFGTNSTLSDVTAQLQIPDAGGMKRTLQVNVKMTEEDFRLLRKVAEKRWRDAVMTNSGTVLALAGISARQILGRSKT